MKIKRAELFQASSPLMFQAKTKDLSLDDLDVISNTFPVELNVDRTGSDLNVKGQVVVNLRETCDRCLTPFDTPMEVTFQLLLTEKESLLSGEQVTDIHLFPVSQHEFDFGPTIQDAILLERSMKQICREDCKGLCPQCGTNLNVKACNCEKDEIDERWAPLKELSSFKTE